MPIAILDAFSGIAGDMTLGALVDTGLPPEWLTTLPQRLRLEDVSVRVSKVKRCDIACTKVDFEIPTQPHGRHLHHILELIGRAEMPPTVRSRAEAAFRAIVAAEGAIHDLPMERVHLHEVGSVDAILDVVGAMWGFEILGVSAVFCGPIALGDGFVSAAHGVLPVPAPATLKLLEGHVVRTGPEGTGELVTPTGAALVRVLSRGPPPTRYVPIRSGFGAGTKELPGRPNALRLILADEARSAVSSGDHGAGQPEVVEELVELLVDVDDMNGEHLAAVAEMLREAGALDVVLFPSLMKKGRPGVRIEVLARPRQATALEDLLLTQSSSIGVRRITVERRALSRETATVQLLGHDVRIKIVTLPDGKRAPKPEFDDIASIAKATGRSVREVSGLAHRVAERAMSQRVRE
ncbi:MAG: nickel pincer cofactor biosynthesis protein LarC [Gemmatimonadaceae bacterium]